MAYTLKLDTFSNDLQIRQGKLVRLSGADEVRQRVKVLLWHYLSEYFLNRPGGMPYYKSNPSVISILGSKISSQTLYNIMREKIMSVPGVLRLTNANISKQGRNYFYSCQILVQRGPGDKEGESVMIQSLEIGA